MAIWYLYTPLTVTPSHAVTGEVQKDTNKFPINQGKSRNISPTTRGYLWVSYPQESLENTINTMGTLLGGGFNSCLGGGFNPFETYSSKCESSPSRGENKTYLKPPPSCWLNHPCKQQTCASPNWIISARIRGKHKKIFETAMLISICSMYGIFTYI